MPQNLYAASREWATRPDDQRFETLDALHRAVLNRRSLSTQYPVPMSAVSVQADGSEIFVSTPLNEMVPTNWSFGQLCKRVGAPPAYLAELPAELVVRNLAHGIELHQDEEVQVYVASDTGTQRLMAATSDKYTRIYDEEIVAWIKRSTEGKSWILPLANPVGVYTGRPATLEEGGRPAGAYASDRDVFIFMVDPGNPVTLGDEVLYRGFFAANSEVGDRSFSVTTFLYRVVCGNHIVWGAEDVRQFRQIHIGNRAGERARIQLGQILDQYRNRGTAEITAGIRKAMEFNVGKDRDEAVAWLRAKGFTKKLAEDATLLAETQMGGCGTLWQVHNGLTAAAQKIPHRDLRTALEKQAGDLLDLAA